MALFDCALRRPERPRPRAFTYAHGPRARSARPCSCRWAQRATVKGVTVGPVATTWAPRWCWRTPTTCPCVPARNRGGRGRRRARVHALRRPHAHGFGRLPGVLAWPTPLKLGRRRADVQVHLRRRQGALDARGQHAHPGAASGADIAMQLDQCAPYPGGARASWSGPWTCPQPGRDAAWRPTRAPTRRSSASCQGGMHLDLRLEIRRGRLRAIEDESLAAGGRRFGGFGIGGYSVGESHEVMFETLGQVARALPRGPPALPHGRGQPHHARARRRARAWTCSTACCPRARPAWAPRSAQRRPHEPAQREVRSRLRPARPCSARAPPARTTASAYLRHLVKQNEMLGAASCCPSTTCISFWTSCARAREAVLADDYESVPATLGWQAPPRTTTEPDGHAAERVRRARPSGGGAGSASFAAQGRRAKRPCHATAFGAKRRQEQID